MTSTEIANASKIMIGSTEAVKMYIGSTLVWNKEPEYVDLGLPSGLLWATYDIGAQQEGYAGAFYQYGEVSDNDIRQLYGDKWRMPTMREFDELFCYCAMENNYKLVSKINGNYIYFPRIGYMVDGTRYLNGALAAHWTSESVSDTNAYLALTWSASGTLTSGNKTEGCNIRPVKEPPQYNGPVIVLPIGYTRIDGLKSTGNQYIDVGIKLYETLNTNYDIQISFYVHDNSGTLPTMFGCLNLTNPWPGTFIRISGDGVVGRYIGGSAKDNTLTRNHYYENVLLATKKSPDKNVTNLNNNGTTHQFGTSLFCAFLDTNNTPFRFILATLYGFTLYINGVPVRLFIPCKNENNVAGLYDVINNQFYSSPNGNSFTAVGTASPTVQ